MSDGIGELVAHLSIDTEGFTDPIQRSAQVAQESGEKIVRVIHEQQTSYLAMTAQVIQGAGNLGGALIAAANKSQSAGAAISSGWSGMGAGIATAALALKNYAAQALAFVGQFIPQLKVVAIAAGIAAAAYAVFGGGGGGEDQSSRISAVREYAATAISENTNVANSWRKVTDEVDKLQTSIGFSSGQIAALPQGFLDAAKEALGFNAIVAESETLISKLADSVVSRMAQARTALEGAFDAALGLGNLRELTAETERLGAVQAKQAGGFAALGKIQQDAADAAGRAAELAEIAQLDTIDAIDERIRKEQDLQALAVRNGTFDAGSAKAKFDALHKRRDDVASGRVDNETDRAAKAIANQAAAISMQAEDRISALAEQYAQLAGRATKADIAMRQAAAAGYSEEQVATIGKLVSETEALTKANEAANSLMARGAALTEQYLTDQQKITRDKKELNRLHAEGAIDDATLKRGLADIDKRGKSKTDDRQGVAAVGAFSSAGFSAVAGAFRQARGSTEDKSLALQQQALAAARATQRATEDVARRLQPAVPVSI